MVHNQKTASASMSTLYQEILPPYFILKYRPTSRDEKRLLDREYEKVVKELLHVDFHFISCLFDDDMDESYQELFTRFNNAYKQIAANIKKSAKLKFIEVNENYFYQEYRPIETI